METMRKNGALGSSPLCCSKAGRCDLRMPNRLRNQEAKGKPQHLSCLGAWTPNS